MTSLEPDYLCKDPVSQRGHILRFQGLACQHMNFGGHQSTQSNKSEEKSKRVGKFTLQENSR